MKLQGVIRCSLRLLGIQIVGTAYQPMRRMMIRFAMAANTRAYERSELSQENEINSLNWLINFSPS